MGFNFRADGRTDAASQRWRRTFATLGIAGLISAPLAVLPASPASAAGFCDDSANVDVTFDNGDGDGVLTNADNWDGGVLPTSADTVCIPTAAGSVSLGDGDSLTVGNLHIQQGVSVALGNNATIEADGGAGIVELDGTLNTEALGTIDGNLENHATGAISINGFENLLTAGALNVSGDYQQDAGGALNVDWLDNGGVSGTDYDSLAVTGDATMADGAAINVNAETFVDTAAFNVVSAANIVDNGADLNNSVFGYALSALIVTGTPDVLQLTAAARGGAISGTVTETPDNASVGIDLGIDFNADGLFTGPGETVTTDPATGEFTFGPLDAGSYTIVVLPGQGVTLTSGFAAPVTVGTTEVTGVDAAVSFNASADISGTVFNDLNADGTIDPEDVIPAANVLVYIDADSDGSFTEPDPDADPVVEGDPFVITDVDGTYAFDGVENGTVTLGAVIDPADNGTVTLTPSPVTLSGEPEVADFAVTYAGSISGTVTFDAGDANGSVSEVGVEIDRNGDGNWESTAIDSSDGTYEFTSVPSGEFVVNTTTGLRNFFQTSPRSQEVEVADGDPTTGVDFATVPVAVNGYNFVASDGGVFSYGDAEFKGSMGGQSLNRPVVGMANVPAAAGDGYWLVASDGGVFAYGDAQFFGSMGGQRLNSPVVGITPTASGNGYWLAAADGGVFAFGDAQFRGSMGGSNLNRPVVGIAADPDGDGYWLAASDGGIFAYNATFSGSMGGKPLNSPVVGLAADQDGSGYWLVAADGGVFAFDATFHGSMGGKNLNRPVVGMAAVPEGSPGEGYHLVAADGGVFSFPDGAMPFYGSMGGSSLNRPVVGMSSL